MPEVKGFLPAMVTPMTEDESINLGAVKPIVERLLEAGADGIYALGTAGEFYALDEDEKVSFMEKVMEAVNGRVPVWAGVGGITTRSVTSLIRRLEPLRPTGFSVVTPYFLNLTQDELKEHHTETASSTDLPMLLYNLPPFTRLTLSPDTVAAIAERCNNVVGMKDSSGDIALMRAYKELLRPDFSIICGQDALIHTALKLGAAGIVSAPSNVTPRLFSALYKAHLAGDEAAAQGYQTLVDELCATLTGTTPGPAKQAMRLTGMDAGFARRPVSRVSVAQLARMERVIRKIQLTVEV